MPNLERVRLGQVENRPIIFPKGLGSGKKIAPLFILVPRIGIVVYLTHGQVRNP